MLISEGPEETKKLILRWRIVFPIIAAAALALAIVLNVLAASSSEAAIRQNVNTILEERFDSVFEGRNAPVAGDRIRFEEGGNSFEFVFAARARNLANSDAYSGDLIFAVPVISFSGASVGVFYYMQGTGARFLGFEAGGEISSGSLKKWSSRIERKAQRLYSSSTD